MSKTFLAVEWRYGRGVYDTAGLPSRTVYRFASATERQAWIDDGNSEWRNDRGYREPITGRDLHKSERPTIADVPANVPEEGRVARAVLSSLIDDSGLSIVECARTVFGRDERTVRRWLAGDPIPESVAAWLARVSVDVDADTVTITVLR